jgi:hypothetical protein
LEAGSCAATTLSNWPPFAPLLVMTFMVRFSLLDHLKQLAHG